MSAPPIKSIIILKIVPAVNSASKSLISKLYIKILNFYKCLYFMLIQKNNEFLNFFTLRIFHISEFYINLFLEIRNYNKINVGKFGFANYSSRNIQNIHFIKLL